MKVAAREDLSVRFFDLIRSVAMPAFACFHAYWVFGIYVATQVYLPASRR